MQRMEAENAEVSGDEPESDIDDEDVEEIEEAKANGAEWEWPEFIGVGM